MLPDLAQNAARISDCDDICGQVLCHDASRADYRIPSDMYTGNDHYTGSDPDILTDGHILIVL